jgi:tetratricopeptide (TPR) repeat protein
MSEKKVFISYSHDSTEHSERVLALSERLRADGIETFLDQYLNGSPVQGWPRWMLDQLDAADFVLVVCTESYYRRFRGHELPGKGKGADWEGALITQEIYVSRSSTLKFVPLLFSSDDEKFIPEPLRATTYYSPVSENAYQALYDFLLGVAGVEPGPIGPMKTRKRRQAKPLEFNTGAETSVSPPSSKKSKSKPKRDAAKSGIDAVDLYRRALRAIADEQYDEALALLDQSIEINPSFAEAFYNRGLTYYSQNDMDRAIEDFDRSLELGFDDALLYRNRGNAHSRKGDVEGALSDYAQAIALEPEDGGVYLNRGQVYENTRQKELAKADYQTVLTLACDEWIKEEARKRLTSMGVKLKQPSPALAIWQKKLAFLQSEEAKASDPMQKFSIQQSIEEAEAKIRELGG